MVAICRGDFPTPHTTSGKPVRLSLRHCMLTCVAHTCTEGHHSPRHLTVQQNSSDSLIVHASWCATQQYEYMAHSVCCRLDGVWSHAVSLEN